MFGQQTIADSDVTFGSSAYNYGLAFVLVVINFTSRRTSEDLQFEFVLAIVIVHIEALLQMDLLLLLLVVRWLHVLLNIRVTVEQRVRDYVHHDVRFANVN